jgi:D-tyrosyl-tRNA(Tyr) deacylase
VGKSVAGRIGKGLFVLIGVGKFDTKREAQFLAEKLCKLRILADSESKMNLSSIETKSQILVVSQFTLYADTSGGNRPSFTDAKDPVEAEVLYKYFIDILKKKGVDVQSGSFGNYMNITAELDGPVTIMIDSKVAK